MPHFVYDGTALPGTKTDANPLGGPAEESLQASEFNVLTSASYDIRNALISASYLGFVRNSTASLPPLNAMWLRFSGSNLQVAEGGTGVGYRIVPVLDSGTLNLDTGGVSGSGVGSFTAVSSSQGFWANVSSSQLWVLKNGARGIGDWWGIWTQMQDGRADDIMNFRAAGIELLRLNPSGSTIGNVAAPHNLNIIGAVTASLDLRVGRNTTIVGSLTASAILDNSVTSWASATLLNGKGNTGDFFGPPGSSYFHAAYRYDPSRGALYVRGCITGAFPGDDVTQPALRAIFTVPTSMAPAFQQFVPAYQVFNPQSGAPGTAFGFYIDTNGTCSFSSNQARVTASFMYNAILSTL